MSRRFVLVLGVGLALPSSLACDSTSGGPNPSDAKAPDATLRTHAVEPSTPTAEGLAYVRTMARIHEEADAAEGARREEILRRGLSEPVPAGLAEAEILRLDVAVRLAQILMAQPDGASAARDLLRPLLRTDRSLPMDRASARALVVLGDASREVGDDALAAGSYMRAVRMMSLLRQELQP